MEISRPFKPILIIPSAGTDASQNTKVQPHQPQAATARGDSEVLPLEQMQQALSVLPEVDTDKVAAIKLALQRGEISTDPAELASSMLAFHRGSDM